MDIDVKNLGGSAALGRFGLPLSHWPVLKLATLTIPN